MKTRDIFVMLIKDKIKYLEYKLKTKDKHKFEMTARFLRILYDLLFELEPKYKTILYGEASRWDWAMGGKEIGISGSANVNTKIRKPMFV